MSLSYSSIPLAGTGREEPDRQALHHAAIRELPVLVGHYRKKTIVDDEEWFAAGGRVAVFDAGGATFGIAIRADIGDESVFAESRTGGAYGRILRLPSERPEFVIGLRRG
jgi:hypothetical protein